MRLIKVICGDGLPVSLMLVGRHFDEPTIYRAAFAFERMRDWKAMWAFASNRGQAGKMQADPALDTRTRRQC
jgi:hypothetical protein